MPTQGIHVLRNPGNETSNPWHEADFGDTLATPEWVFKQTDRKRF